MVIINGQTELITKVNGTRTKYMDKALVNGRMVVNLQGHGKRMK
jgi:hypothetical protein